MPNEVYENVEVSAVAIMDQTGKIYLDHNRKWKCFTLPIDQA